MEQQAQLSEVSPENNQGGISLSAITLFYRFLANWYWFVLGAAITVFIAWTLLRYTIPIYSVKTVILIKDGKKNAFSQEAIATELGKFTGNEKTTPIADVLQIFKSTDLMRRVVDTLGLHYTYSIVGKVISAEAFEDTPLELTLVSFPDSAYDKKILISPVDSSSFALIQQNKKDTLRCRYGTPFYTDGIIAIINRRWVLNNNFQYQISVRDPDDVARDFARNKLNILKVKESNALELTIKETVPDRGVAILKQLLKEYNAKVLEDKNLAGNQTLKFIDERLIYIKRELFDVEQEAESFRETRRIPLGLSQEAASYMGKVNEGDKDLVEIDVRASVLDNFKNFLSDEANKFKPLPIGSELFASNLNVSESIKKYNELITKREEKLKYASEDNPILLSLEKPLSDLRKNILLSLQNVRQEMEIRRQKVKQQMLPIESQIKLSSSK